MRYAIGEIILVVIGILIALQINNWNDNRKDSIQEKIEVLQRAFQIVGVRDHRSDVPADSDPKENEAELEKVEAEPIEHGDLGAGAEVDTPAKVIKARKAGQSIVAGQKPAKRKLTEAQRKKAGLNKV